MSGLDFSIKALAQFENEKNMANDVEVNQGMQRAEMLWIKNGYQRISENS